MRLVHLSSFGTSPLRNLMLVVWFEWFRCLLHWKKCLSFKSNGVWRKMIFLSKFKLFMASTFPLLSCFLQKSDIAFMSNLLKENVLFYPLKSMARWQQHLTFIFSLDPTSTMKMRYLYLHQLNGKSYVTVRLLKILIFNTWCVVSARNGSMCNVYQVTVWSRLFCAGVAIRSMLANKVFDYGRMSGIIILGNMYYYFLFKIKPK